MIKTPFANYKRAHLERLVHEAFEHIEREANRLENEATQWVENEATQWVENEATQSQHRDCLWISLTFRF
jgi:hypothetical protein